MPSAEAERTDYDTAILCFRAIFTAHAALGIKPEYAPIKGP